MFPGPGANIIRNEAGEPLGWDYPAEPEFDDFDRDYDREADVCPYCDRVMSHREAAEQGACNDCFEPT